MNNEKNQILGLCLLGFIFILMVVSMVAGFATAMKLHDQEAAEYRLNDTIKDIQADSIKETEVDTIKGVE